jgi:hypothetical protein
MERPLDDDAVIGELNRAFRPLTCVAGIYGHQLRYHVYNPNGQTVVSVTGLQLSSVLDPEQLRVEIEETRALLESYGFNLDPWIGFLI